MMVHLLSAAFMFVSLPAGAERAGVGGAGEDTCAAASCQRFGRRPAELGKSVKPPTRIRYVAFGYPPIPTGTIGRGTWVGEALICPHGHVHKVVVVRDLEFTPPFPAYSKAIADSILEWRYAPTLVDGEPVPVCVTISVNINWR